VGKKELGTNPPQPTSECGLRILMFPSEPSTPRAIPAVRENADEVPLLTENLYDYADL